MCDVCSRHRAPSAAYDSQMSQGSCAWNPSATVDVDRVLESAKLRGPALVVLLCAASSLILDGFDIQAVGFVAPALVGALQVERAALGPALAASLVGMAIGAAGIGALGDRWGRRRTLLLSTALFGAASLLAATATSVATLAVWRFVTGIGLGGALTAATALIAEFSPRRFRPLAIGAIQIGVPIGGMLGAMLCCRADSCIRLAQRLRDRWRVAAAHSSSHVFRVAGIPALSRDPAAGARVAGATAGDASIRAAATRPATCSCSARNRARPGPASVHCSRRSCAGTRRSCRSHS